jgi:hypothetical protein
MADGGNHVEANVARLIQAAFGGMARLDRRPRERTWRRLVVELRLGQPPEFPDRVLALLGLVLIGGGAWLAIRVAGAGAGGSMRLPDVLVVLTLAMNLAFAPLATLVILLRRQRHASSV